MTREHAERVSDISRR